MYLRYASFLLTLANSSTSVFVLIRISERVLCIQTSALYTSSVSNTSTDIALALLQSDYQLTEISTY